MEKQRRNMVAALEAIGEGFVRYMRAHPAEFRTKTMDTIAGEIYQESIAFIYRLLFLLLAERQCDSVVGDFHSLVTAILNAPSPSENDCTLWHRLSGSIISHPFAYGLTGLFDPLRYSPLGQADVSDAALIATLHFLNLPLTGHWDVRILGDIYQFILEVTPSIAVKDGPHGDEIRFSLSPAGRESRRKRSGSYYTNEHITHYIAETALGRLVSGENRSGNLIGMPLSSQEILDLRVLDPAMGTGNFLIAAIGYLARAYAAALNRETGMSRPDEEYRSLIAEHCIYGMDIDPTAVEIARLSMGLYCMDTSRKCRENEQTFRSRPILPSPTRPLASPTLACGNFLGRLSGEFGGGFDAVIGNPPYVSAKELGDVADLLRTRFSTARGAFDIYVPFVEQGLRSLKETGILGMILSNKFAVSDYGKNLRTLLQSVTFVSHVVELADSPDAFPGASIGTTILIVNRNIAPYETRIAVLRGSCAELREINSAAPGEHPWGSLELRTNAGLFDADTGHLNVRMSARTREVIKALRHNSVPFGEIAEIRTGVMGFEYWRLEENTQDYARPGDSNLKLVTPGLIHPFQIKWGTKRVRLYRKDYQHPVLIQPEEVVDARTLEMFRSPKIVLRGIARRVTAAMDEEGIAILVAVHSARPHNPESMWLLTGLLNSQVVNALHRIQYYGARVPKGSLRYPVSFWRHVPIPQSVAQYAPGLDQDQISPDLLPFDRETQNWVQQASELQTFDAGRLCSTLAETARLISRLGDGDPDLPRLINTLDASAYALYGLSASEITFLENIS